MKMKKDKQERGNVVRKIKNKKEKAYKKEKRMKD
jgi:hypothetical protein